MHAVIKLKYIQLCYVRTVKDPALLMDSSLSPTLRPPGDGVENSLIYSISSFTSFTLTIPWYQGVTWYQFSFPAPKLYGSPKLGVLGSPVLEA